MGSHQILVKSKNESTHFWTLPKFDDYPCPSHLDFKFFISKRGSTKMIPKQKKWDVKEMFDTLVKTFEEVRDKLNSNNNKQRIHCDECEEDEITDAVQCEGCKRWYCEGCSTDGGKSIIFFFGLEMRCDNCFFENNYYCLNQLKKNHICGSFDCTSIMENQEKKKQKFPSRGLCCVELGTTLCYVCEEKRNDKRLSNLDEINKKMTREEYEQEKEDFPTLFYEKLSSCRSEDDPLILDRFAHLSYCYERVLKIKNHDDASREFKRIKLRLKNDDIDDNYDLYN